MSLPQPTEHTYHEGQDQSSRLHPPHARRQLLAFSPLTAAVLLAMLWIGLAQSAGASVHYVAPGGDCSGAQPCYAVIQTAVDVAQPGDEIRIAQGLYTGVNNYGGLAQLVYISKSVTLRGGYAISDWATPLAGNAATILDAQQAGRVLYMHGNITVTVETVKLTGGNADGLLGSPRFAGYSAGGGFYAITSTLNMSNMTWRENHAGVGGGGYIEGGRLTLRNSILLSNTADFGGGLFAEGGDSLLEGNVMSGNLGDGGGIAIYLGRATLHNNRLQRNRSSNHGGGVLLVDCEGTLSQNVLSHNEGLTGGGASLSGDITLIQNTVAGNRADVGAGLSLSDGTITLRQNTISDNHATAVGGGIAFSSTPGGPHPDQQVLTNNIISGNVAAQGGGIYMSYVQPRFAHNQIVGNHALDYGGGLLQNEARTHMDGDVVSGNSAGHKGGGIAMQQRSDSYFANVVLLKNEADEEGSALWIWGSTLELAQATFADNPGRSGVFVQEFPPLVNWSSWLTVTNAIMVSHTTALVAVDQSNVTVDGMLFSGNDIDTDGSGQISVTHVVTGPPAFAPDGYHLTPASQALNRGIPADVSYDLDGQPRFSGEVDLGADEYWPAGSLQLTYLPALQRQ